MAAVFKIQKHTITCMLALVCLAVLVRESNARPPRLARGSGVFSDSAQCDTDDELLDLCQRCAKLIKPNTAMSACCSTDIKARRFCSDFVYFGTYPSRYKFR